MLKRLVWDCDTINADKENSDILTRDYFRRSKSFISNGSAHNSEEFFRTGWLVHLCSGADEGGEEELKPLVREP